MTLAPIALFAYNRPDHVRQAVGALRANPLAQSSDLHVFSDGAKNPAAERLVSEVRDYLGTITGFASVRIVERNRNFGLAASVIDGVTDLCNAAGKVIVVEDDLLVAPQFLDYMNTALYRYRDDEKAMQVSGFMFPVKVQASTDSFFLPFTTSWGWATWARAWNSFDPQMSGFEALSADRRLRDAFNLHGTYDYYDMLRRQRAGEVDSWAIRWYLSVFMRAGLTLYPARSLVRNIGFDGTGTHCGVDDFGQQSDLANAHVGSFPEQAALHPEWRQVLAGMPRRAPRLKELAGMLRRHANRLFSTGSEV